jgi:hypothetical protein
MVKYYFAGIQSMLMFAHNFLGQSKTQGNNTK